MITIELVEQKGWGKENLVSLFNQMEAKCDGYVKKIHATELELKNAICDIDFWKREFSILKMSSKKTDMDLVEINAELQRANSSIVYLKEHLSEKSTDEELCRQINMAATDIRDILTGLEQETLNFKPAFDSI